MYRRRWLAELVRVCAAMSLIALVTGCPAGDDDDSADEGWTWVDPAESSPFGQTWADWAAASWNTITGIPAATNPLFGGDCTQGQSGDVWFLAGSFGGEETRNCTIPHGKAIHIPVRNTIGFACPELFGPEDCAWADAEGLEGLVADWPPDGVVPAMWVDVDETPLEGIESYLVHSSAFEMAYPTDANSIFYIEDADFDCGQPWLEGNECDSEAGAPKLAATAGYYPMAAPPPVGNYTLHFRTENEDASWVIDITYNLTVE